MTIHPITLRRNRNDELEIGQVSLLELAERYGTPLYVLCEDTIRHNCHPYRRFLRENYSHAYVLYVAKANYF